jgi:hypothetical protein
MGYLLILNYESDAERKRIDYAIERWDERVKIWKPKGMILMLEGSSDELNEFLEDILSRLEFKPEDSPKRKVKVYEVHRLRAEVEKKAERLFYETSIDAETAKRFINYLMAKVNAVYEYSDGFSKVYAAYTKKGHAKIVLRIEEKELTIIEILIEGYGEVAEFLAAKLKNELDSFLGGG